LVVPQVVATGTENKNLAAVLGRLLRPASRKRFAIEEAGKKATPRHYPVRIDFQDVDAVPMPLQTGLMRTTRRQ